MAAPGARATAPEGSDLPGDISLRVEQDALRVDRDPVTAVPAPRPELAAGDLPPQVVGKPAAEAKVPPALRAQVDRTARRAPAGLLLAAADLCLLAGYVGLGGDLVVPLVAFWLVTCGLFAWGDLYHVRLQLSVLDEVPDLVFRTAGAAALVGVALGGQQGRSRMTGFFVAAALGLAGHLAGRAAAHGLLGRLHRSGRAGRRVLVLGGGEVSRRIVGHLDATPRLGLRVIGYVDVPAPAQVREPDPTSTPRGWIRLGVPEDVARLIRRHEIDVVVVGYGWCRDEVLADILKDADRRVQGVYVVQRLFEVGRPGSPVHRIGPVTLHPLRLAPFSGLQWSLKRAIDVLVAGTGLLLLAPVLAAVALAVRIEGGRGVIFRQVRVGRDGQHFHILKFRSLKPSPGEGDVNWSIAGDDRMGRVGRFIRSTSLDELPQLVNVLRGEMTLVGPRPERPYFVERFDAEIPHYRHRHRVRAGVTGFAQVNGLRGSDGSIAERARFDNYYIENHSLWLDVKVLLQTLRHVIAGSGS